MTQSTTSVKNSFGPDVLETGTDSLTRKAAMPPVLVSMVSSRFLMFNQNKANLYYNRIKSIDGGICTDTMIFVHR